MAQQVSATILIGWSQHVRPGSHSVKWQAQMSCLAHPSTFQQSQSLSSVPWSEVM